MSKIDYRAVIVAVIVAIAGVLGLNLCTHTGGDCPCPAPVVKDAE